MSQKPRIRLLAVMTAVSIGAIQYTPALGLDRDFNFKKSKATAKKKNRQQNNSRGFFSFFDFSGSNGNRQRDTRVAVPPAKKKSLIYTYRRTGLVSLGDQKLKQPSNRQTPLFGGQLPAGQNVTSDLTGPQMLDDSLAQLIFETLKASEAGSRVTRKQAKAIIAFYKRRNYTAVWTDMDGVSDKAKAVMAILAKAGDDGMNAQNYLPAGLAGFDDPLEAVDTDLKERARFDINLTAMALRYAQDASGGQVVPNRLSGYHDLKPPRVDVEDALAKLAKSDDPSAYLAGLQPHHPGYQAMKKALMKIRASNEKVKHIPIIARGPMLKIGRSDDRVPMLRKRMTDMGFFKPEQIKVAENDVTLAGDEKPVSDANAALVEPDPLVYDEALAKAVKDYQKSKGLRPDGIVGGRTLAALNKRKSVNRTGRLVLNMERMRWLPRSFGSKHIFVNQPAYELRVMSRGSQIWKTRVVIGKPRNQTSFFIDKMETVVFNPYWGVPQSIIVNEMLPRLRANPGYLDGKGFQVFNRAGRKVSSSSIDWYNYGGRAVPFSVRQPPSARNALGKVKFLFPNKHAIYMHDTPSKHLFARSKRAFSHGCVRVQNPFTLAEKVLGWSRSRIDSKVATGKNGSVRLAKTIPVYLTYFTAFPDAKGKMQYFSDIYGRDARLNRALNVVTLASR